VIFKNKYRIVRDCFAGYEAQVKSWWWPFWREIDFVNTHSTMESAERCAKEHAAGGVKILGFLP